jgi:hypothetical protein
MEGPELVVAKDALLEAYNDRLQKQGVSPITANTFTRELHKRVPHITVTQRTLAGTVKYVWLGIGLASKDTTGASQASQLSQVSPYLNLTRAPNVLKDLESVEGGGTLNKEKS